MRHEVPYSPIYIYIVACFGNYLCYIKYIPIGKLQKKLNFNTLILFIRSKLMAFRKANLEAFTKKYGVKLSFMSPFLKAAANALMDQPVINAVIIGDEIIYR